MNQIANKQPSDRIPFSENQPRQEGESSSEFEEARQLFECPQQSQQELAPFEQYPFFIEYKKWNEKITEQKKGKFSPKQKRTLLKHLKKCLAEVDLTYEKFQKIIEDEPDYKLPRNLKIWTRVCDVLPHRSLKSCYKHLKRQVGRKKGKWSEHETQRLKELVKEHGKKWTLISRAIGRTSENVRDKYRRLGEESKELWKEMWELSTLVQFLRFVQKSTELKFMDEGIEAELRGEEGHNTIEANERAKKKKNSKFFTFHNNLVVSKYLNENFLQIRSEHIEWKEISCKLKTKTEASCRSKLKQLMLLALRTKPSELDLNRSLVGVIERLGYESQAGIDWEAVGRQMKGDPSAVKHRWELMRKQASHKNGRSLKRVTRWLGKIYRLDD